MGLNRKGFQVNSGAAYVFHVWQNVRLRWYRLSYTANSFVSYWPKPAIDGAVVDVPQQIRDGLSML
jgi:hypothetical protein